jgi:uncharacterized protein YbjT (DUF2867 family)
MRLLVLGATGGVGIEILRQALERGHHVTALVRSPEALKPFADKITIVQGDILNSKTLENVVEVTRLSFRRSAPVSRAPRAIQSCVRVLRKR